MPSQFAPALIDHELSELVTESLRIGTGSRRAEHTFAICTTQNLMRTVCELTALTTMTADIEIIQTAIRIQQPCTLPVRSAEST